MCGDCKFCKRITINALRRAGFICVKHDIVVRPADSGCDDEVMDDAKEKSGESRR